MRLSKSVTLASPKPRMKTLLKVAQAQSRLFVTRDRDFGGLVFVNALGAGVLYLRILPSTQNAVHREWERVLTIYPEEELRKAFVVIEPGGHRFRKLTSKDLSVMSTRSTSAHAWANNRLQPCDPRRPAERL